ncbi:MAG: hypothetical protein QM820_39565 [Minicystis sp.]
MLKIKKRQMDALRRYVRGSFEDAMCAHVAQYFPRKCAALGEPGVREVVRYGVERAAAHGFEEPQEMGAYIDSDVHLRARFRRGPGAAVGAGDPRRPRGRGESDWAPSGRRV